MAIEIIGADEFLVGAGAITNYNPGGGIVPAGYPFHPLATSPGYPTGQMHVNQAAQAAAATAAAVKSVEAKTLVKEQGPSVGRDLVIGFAELAIAAGASASATQRPQVVFRPSRIVVPTAVAPNFTIDDIKIGNKSQLVSNGSIPAEAFEQNAFGVQMRMDTCGISQDFILDVTNQTAGAEDFRAAAYGTAVW